MQASCEESRKPRRRQNLRGIGTILSALQIRESGARLVDTRNVFQGHADIRHDIVPRRGEPLPPEQLKTLHDRAKALANRANYFPDPDPTAEPWTGHDLHYKS